MILYDQNNNFIGMSNETLSYLGYEDLSDFTSQHSDFANLLVNKEGYIYKFQNFSWIDFILYSGSPNKSALLQLKTGEPLEVKLSVKEVHLATELGNNSKFYSVRILSDNFVDIAAKTDENITKQSSPKNAFNLNSLITEEEHTTNIETKPDIPVVNEPSTTSDFSLNFPSSDNLNEEEFVLSMPNDEPSSSDNDFKLNLSDSIFDSKEEESSVKLDASEPDESQEHTEGKQNNDFKLNLSGSIFDSKEEESSVKLDASVADESQEQTEGKQNNDFKLNLSDSIFDSQEKTEGKEDFSLNFLKEEVSSTESTQKVEASLDFLKPKESTDEVDSGFKLKHNTMESEEEKEEKKITLNFLKDETLEEYQEPMTVSQKEVPEVKANLDFLSQIETQEVQEREEIANKDQIIVQIQNDIKEIDGTEEENHSFIQEEQEPQKVDIEGDEINAYLFNKNEVKKEKKSFTNTLQSLFSETKNLPQEQNEEEFVEAFQAPSATLKNKEKSEMHPQVDKDTHRITALASLGLEKEDEDDLILEFVNDTKENIHLFKEFYQSGNVDQAEYTLIKMQSSAYILNLNDIIISLANIKQSCTDGDTKTLTQLTATLDGQVKNLELYLESETV